MNVLITGATGFIGRRLAERLATGGHRVTGLSRNPERAAAAVPAVDRFYYWSTDAPPPAEALAEAAAVVHLAGESVNGRWTAAKKQRIYQSRVHGTRNLVAALAGLEPRVLVSTSAVGFYGDRGDEQLTEASAQGEGFLAEVTRAWETEALQAERHGHRVAALRLGIVIGTEGGALKKVLPLFKAGLGGPLGSGRQWWPWVHVDDVVGTIQAALWQAWQGVYNLTAPEPLQQAEFARALGAAVRRPALLPVPALALRLVQGEFADEILFSKRVLPERLLQAGHRFAFPDAASALEDLLTKETHGPVPARA